MADFTNNEFVMALVLFAIPGLAMAGVTLVFGILWCLVRAFSCGKCCTFSKSMSRGCYSCHMVFFFLIAAATVGFSLYGVFENQSLQEGITEFMSNAVDITSQAYLAISRATALNDISTQAQSIEELKVIVSEASKAIGDINDTTESAEDLIVYWDNVRTNIMYAAFIFPLVSILIAMLGICLRKKSFGKCFLWTFMVFMWFSIIFFSLMFSVMLPVTAVVGIVCTELEVLRDTNGTEYKYAMLELQAKSPEVAAFVDSCVESDNFLGPIQDNLAEMQDMVVEFAKEVNGFKDMVEEIKDDIPDVIAQTVDIQGLIAQEKLLLPNITNTSMAEFKLTLEEGDIAEMLTKVQPFTVQLSQALTVLAGAVSEIPDLVMKKAGFDKKDLEDKLNKASVISLDIGILVDALLEVNAVVSCKIIKDLVGNLINSVCDPMQEAFAGVTWASMSLAIAMCFLPFLAQAVVEAHSVNPADMVGDMAEAVPMHPKGGI